jgi:hypothetical protein
MRTMRLTYSSMATLAALVLAGGCAGTPATPRTPERHAANVAAAEAAGYRVITASGRSVFCPTAPPTGSHIGSQCLSESEWEAQLGVPKAPSPQVHVTNQSPGPGPGAGH